MITPYFNNNNFYTHPISIVKRLSEKLAHRLDLGELMSLQAGHVFERQTTLGLLREEMRIAEAEKAAGQYDPAHGISDAAYSYEGHRHAITREEWERATLEADIRSQEMDITRLEAEGRATPEDRLDLEAARRDVERVDALEDISLSLVGCVLEAL